MGTHQYRHARTSTVMPKTSGAVSLPELARVLCVGFIFVRSVPVIIYVGYMRAAHNTIFFKRNTLQFSYDVRVVRCAFSVPLGNVWLKRTASLFFFFFFSSSSLSFFFSSHLAYGRWWCFVVVCILTYSQIRYCSWKLLFFLCVPHISLTRDHIGWILFTESFFFFSFPREQKKCFIFHLNW